MTLNGNSALLTGVADVSTAALSSALSSSVTDSRHQSTPSTAVTVLQQQLTNGTIAGKLRSGTADTASYASTSCMTIYCILCSATSSVLLTKYRG